MHWGLPYDMQVEKTPKLWFLSFCLRQKMFSESKKEFKGGILSKEDIFVLK